MTRRVELVAVAALSVFVTLAGPPAVVSAQNLVVDPQLLHVRASQTPDGRWHATPLGVVRLDRTDTAVTPWRAEPTVPWLTVTPAEGAGPAGLTVHVDPARLDGASGIGEVVISSNGAAIQRITVRASVVSSDQPPIGVIDAPADGEVAEGPLRLFGWVLDDVGVSSIEICRAGAIGPAEEPCADGQGVRVAWAELHLGDRPDVAAAFPGFDHAHPAGWTAAFTAPATPGSQTEATSYYALARDVGGHVVSLGSKSYRVTRAVVPRVQVRGPLGVLFGAFIVFLVVHLWARRWVVAWPDLPLPLAPAPRPGPGLAEAAALVAILAVFVWLALPGLTRSFDYDEMYSASQFIVGQSWWDSATRVQTLNNHFANSVLASAAVRLLGPVEWVIRLPAFTLALAAIVVTWRFSRRLSGPVAALCAAALLAISPAFLLWGQSARGYTGLACLGWLSVDAFFRVLRTGDVRQARVHTITTVLLPLFHLFGLSFLVVEYLAFLGWSLATRRTVRPAVSVEGLRRLHRSFLAIGAATLLILLPLAGDVVSARPGSSPATPSATAAMTAGTPAATPAVSRAVPGAGVKLDSLAVEMVSSRSSIVWLVAGALLTLGLVALPTRDATVGVAVLVVPLFLLWMEGQNVTVFPRYFSFWIPMLAILLAAGIVAPLQWHRQWTSRSLKGVALALGVVTIAGGLFLARTFLDSTPSHSTTGYREWLARPEGWADSAVAVVGQDAFMFDFYLGKSATRVIDPAQMDRLLRRGDKLLVAYHDRPRNRPADRLVRDLLLRRCLDHRRGNIVMFTCR